MCRILYLLTWMGLIWCPGLLGAADRKFEFKDGDRVVLLGNTLIEREQRYGYWELALTLHNHNKSITFRNLGWSGDTVFGQARAGFGTAADGFKHLKEHVYALQPTVIILGYGGVEAFDGPEGLPRFIRGLGVLLDTLAHTKARMVILSPQRHENLGRPLPDPLAQNANVRLYRDAMRSVALERGHYFIDLYSLVEDGAAQTPPVPLTDNGIHYTASGYRRSAAALVKGLGWELHSPGLPQSRDGDSNRNASSDPIEKLRRLIVQKNELYFHRWRPQNITYLLGFRKYEQGNNAVEIPQYDPLVARLEAEIAKLRPLAAKVSGVLPERKAAK